MPNLSGLPSIATMALRGAQSARELRIRIGMRRKWITSSTLGLILALAALQGAQAREPFAAHAAKVNSKPQNPNPKGQSTSLSRVSATVSGVRSSVRPAVARSQGNVTAEYSFSPVSPLASKSGSEPTAQKVAVAGQAKETGPATDPSERKVVTFFRLNPKFGDVSVQPVIGGGVNGAQLAVGF